jgi:putative component of toxin-antitoxin plasmid stabilization module
MLSVLEYVDGSGSSPFAGWFQTLDATAAAKVTTAIRRLELGNFSNVKGVGAGGGTKKRQDRDIAIAQQRWADYKKRRTQEK